jgi:hypothetical protein
MLEKRNLFLKFLRAGRTYAFDLEQQKSRGRLLYYDYTEQNFTEEDGSFYFKNTKYIYTRFVNFQQNHNKHDLYIFITKERKK